MPTSRPGYIYDGTQWIPVGTQPYTTPVKIQATAPSSPNTGDIWIDTSTYVQSADPSSYATVTNVAATYATKSELSSVEAIAMLGL